jgi:hypothetical protein
MLQIVLRMQQHLKRNQHVPNNFLDLILALDIEKGDVKWVTNLPGYDSWTVACITTSNPENCPGTDYGKIINLDIILYVTKNFILLIDFAQAPLLINT